MIKLPLYVSLLLLLAGCSSAKVEIKNDYLVHEDVYRIPTINDDAWMKLVPAGELDAVYMKCPGPEVKIIGYLVLCSKFNYSEMTPDDYVKRIYTNKYFSFWQSCPSPSSPLTDSNFKKLIEGPTFSSRGNSFSLTYETYQANVCSTDQSPTPMMVKDVFIEDKRSYFYLGAHSRFVVLRYASSPERFGQGLKDFDNQVSKFEWVGVESGASR